ncbi:LysR family transcriptional regulator [Deefgea piscis]|nr:LysR family transcriptional regulator [Deefgea piscis]
MIFLALIYQYFSSVMAKLPSFKLLMGFEAAARLGSFSRAADELCLSQSAISHQILQLETQLAQPLFLRVGRGVELTVAGEVLLRSVQRSLSVLAGGLAQIDTYLDPGLVVIVAPAALLQGWLQPRLAALQAAIPELCLVLSVDESARYIDEVDVDLLISQRPLQQAGVQDHTWLSDEWVAVVSPQRMPELQALPVHQHHQVIGLISLEADFQNDGPSHQFRQQLAAFRRRRIYDDVRLQLDAVCRGDGMAYVLRRQASEYLQTGQLLILPDYPRLAAAPWILSSVAGAPRAEIVRQVRDFLLQAGELEAT